MQLISLAFMSPNQVEKQNEFHGILMHLPLHTDEICLMLGFLISGSISARWSILLKCKLLFGISNKQLIHNSDI